MTLLQASPGTRRRMHAHLRHEPEVTARDVGHLGEWLGKQPHLPSVDDDVFLERFLYGCKYNLPRCKKVLDMYYTVRRAVPEFFGNRDPSGDDIRLSTKTAFVVPLPRLSPAGHRVTLQGLLDPEPDRLDALAYLRRSFMILDAHLRMEAWHGDVIIVDLQHVGWPHLAKFTPRLLHKFFVCALDAFPISVKEVHFINSKSFINRFLSIVKPFLKEKLRNRIHAHVGGMETMHDHIPQDMLPEEYGGKAGSIRKLNDDWQKKIESFKEWFLAEESKIADESKRAATIVEYNELFGLDGSFRQLTID